VAPQKNLEKLSFLAKLALELGAAEAKLMPAGKVVVEDRVVLKCKVGCNNYGKTLACPPYTPTVEEFRKILGEYRYVMFMKFDSKAEADVETQKLLSRPTDPTIQGEDKRKVDAFWATWKEEKKQMLASVVKLEKEAMRAGYSLAIGFVSGSCQLCDKCNLETRICAHPDMARMSEDAVGVNVKKTAANAGVTFIFPYPKHPASYALLLID
jgi:predicted metal-binding protein